MSTLPKLAGIATNDLVEQIGNGNFKASYINWSRTMHLLREHAPGWLPELVPNGESVVHKAPVGGFLLIQFRNEESKETTPPVPQAIMDHRNNAIPWDKITARDITDTHRRGVCMAAAFTFGLAYELWAKMPLESGYAPTEKAVEDIAGKPLDGAWQAALDCGWSDVELSEIVNIALEYWDDENVEGAVEYLESKGLDSEAKSAIWTKFPSKFRSAIKAAKKAA